MAEKGRVVLAYKQQGFQQIGGLRRIALEAVANIRDKNPKKQIATLCDSVHGVLPGTEQSLTLQKFDHLLVIGCDSPWAYALAIRARVQRYPVSWMPSFHDPVNAIHQTKARLAQKMLCWLQAIGVVIYVQTSHEEKLLRTKNIECCKLSGHGLPQELRISFRQTQLDSDWTRRIDLLFVGRPTAQKGWPQFLKLVDHSGLLAEAVVPFTPQCETRIRMHHQASDLEVNALMRNSKLVIIPANYESFGIAQLEAVLAGCAVPVLGHWPLWKGFEHLQWSNFQPDALALACKQLCQNEEERRRLNREQYRWIQQHPIMTTPVLPGL